MAGSKPLGERLVAKGMISRPQLREALRGQKVTGEKLGQTLIRLGHLGQDDLMRVLCEGADIPFRAAEELVPDLTALEAVPESVAKTHTALVVGRSDGRLRVALADPFDMGAVTALERAAGCPVEVVGAPDGAIRARLERAYVGGGPDERLEKAISGPAGEYPGRNASGVDGRSGVDGSADGGAPLFGSADALTADGGTAAEIADEIIGRGIGLGATDVHIEPMAAEVRVRYRLDGVLQRGQDYPKTVLAGVVSRIKILAGLNIAETRLPQDGRVRIPYDDREVDLRVSTFPTVHGEDVVLRVLDRSRVELELESLGMAPADVELFREVLKRPHGLIAVTGPTGSGKTTTLYSGLRELNTGERCIMTLEDPVEYEIEGVRQSQVDPRAGLTFASGLRSMLRHDPDVVLVGELRDEETASIALGASLTGHLVLGTLHTSTAAAVIPRLLDVGAEPYVLASTVQLIVAQRLVRRLCSECREVVDVPDSVRERLSLGDVEVFGSRGCVVCRDTGFKGRIGVYELIPVTRTLAPLIYERRSAEEIQRAAGRPTLLQDGLRKVRERVTSLDEVLRVTTR